MCKDFLRLGFSNFIIDPGVRLGYTPTVARQVYNASRVSASTCMRADYSVQPR